MPIHPLPTPNYIQSSPKFSPFFDATLGAINGTHVNGSLSAEECSTLRNRKGVLTQNCLIVCSFDLHFTYVLSGWEGSTTDSTLYHDAHEVDFFVALGRYYLADAGFASYNTLLVPYRNVRYHLCKWKHGNSQYVMISFLAILLLTLIIPPSPCTPKELFNLHHASAHNVVERIFGILKRQFQILYLPPEYNMSIQSHIPTALAALHNFICHYDPEEIDMYRDPTAEFDLEVLEMAATASVGELGTGPASVAERNDVNKRWDRITRDMWAQYSMYLETHVVPTP